MDANLGKGNFQEKEWKIGESLLQENYINSSQLEEALEEQKMTGEKIGEILIKKGWVSQGVVNRFLATQMGVSTFELASYIIENKVIELIPEDISRKYKLIPVFKTGNVLTVAMVEPTNVFIIDELQRHTGCIIEPVLADEMEIKKAQEQYYGTSSSLRELIDGIDKDKLKDTPEVEGEAPIIKLVNIIISKAIEENASDIHIEPEEKFLGIRCRTDGILYRRDSLPKFLEPAVISRVKILANLDVAEKRLPQDGRIMMKIGKKEIDFRVSTCPTVHGENIVLRILDKSNMALGLESLGFLPHQLKDVESLISQPYGIILVTGPTGSGKTTTLYAALQKLNNEDVNIMTVEDPVEYRFPQIRQVQVMPKIGLRFSSALRSFLRQDPDVILVGEIRDLETAEIAVQAALTGHLVFSTLHTNDAPSAFARLTDMGVEPFLVSSSLLGVLAQRLMRKICSYCREEYLPSEEVLKAIGLEKKTGEIKKLYRGKGCKFCNMLGYKGRVAIYEIMPNSTEIQRFTLRKASAKEVREVAVKEGMRTLRDSAIEKLLSGLTTVEEVLRVTKAEVD